MMSEIETPPASPKWRKWALYVGVWFVLGGIVGYSAGYFMEELVSPDMLASLSLSVMIAATVAVIYLAFAAILWAGLLKPALGAKFLNVEDAEELREQMPILRESAMGTALWGAALLALALAAPEGPLAPPVALAIGAGGLVAGCWFAWRSYSACDELMLKMNLEAGALTYGLVLLVLGGWGMLAHLGYVAGPQPLDLLTTCYVLVMVATYIVIGRRGMLVLR